MKPIMELFDIFYKIVNGQKKDHLMLKHFQVFSAPKVAELYWSICHLYP